MASLIPEYGSEDDVGNERSSTDTNTTPMQVEENKTIVNSTRSTKPGLLDNKDNEEEKPPKVKRLKQDQEQQQQSETTISLTRRILIKPPQLIRPNTVVDYQ